jgi:hypothetical protein
MQRVTFVFGVHGSHFKREKGLGLQTSVVKCLGAWVWIDKILSSTILGRWVCGDIMIGPCVEPKYKKEKVYTRTYTVKE